MERRWGKCRAQSCSFLYHSLRKGYLQSGLPLSVLALLLPLAIIPNNLQQFFRKRNIGLCYFFKITLMLPCYTSNKSLSCQRSSYPSMATAFILKRSSCLVLQKLVFLSLPFYFKTVECFVCLTYLKGEFGKGGRFQEPVDIKVLVALTGSYIFHLLE